MLANLGLLALTCATVRAAGQPRGGSLEETIPGIPGEDYPILAVVPSTQFACQGLVDGGYYADVDTQCQGFHICARDGSGGLNKYSFLCPNGTLFQQQYFVCDWWFNVDCSVAQSYYYLNDEIAAEREKYVSPTDLAAGAVGGKLPEGVARGGQRGAGGGGRRAGGNRRGGIAASASEVDKSYTFPATVETNEQLKDNTVNKEYTNEVVDTADVEQSKSDEDPQKFIRKERQLDDPLNFFKDIEYVF